MKKDELNSKLKEAADFLRKHKKAAIAIGIGMPAVLAPVPWAIPVAAKVAAAMGVAAVVKSKCGKKRAKKK